MRTTLLMNAKGGVGKTTTAINMAAELASRGKRVCVIDADPQCNATDFLHSENAPQDDDKPTLYDALTGAAACYQNLLRETRLKGVSMIASDERLFLADLAALRHNGARMRAIRDMTEAMAEDDTFDYVLVDCPPGFTAASTSALAAADDVVIPMRLDAFSLKGEEFLVRQVDAMREFNRRLRIAGVLVTMVKLRTIICRNGMGLLRQSAIPVFDAFIEDSIVADASTYYGMPFRYMPRAVKLAAQYGEFVDEYLKGGARRVR